VAFPLTKEKACPQMLTGLFYNWKMGVKKLWGMLTTTDGAITI
jgi:hypothetical protein